MRPAGFHPTALENARRGPRAPAGRPDNPIEKKTMKKILSLSVCGVVALAAAGCLGFERKSTVTAPTTTGMGALAGMMGSWTSATVIPNPANCTDFKWNVTEQTTNSARGAFSATCANDLKLTGTAQGTLSGSVVNWSAEGTANAAAGLVSCRFSLTGTAELGVDPIRVPYSGDTCLGRVSGVEILRKQ